MPTVCITGATGFIGRHLVEALQSDGSCNLVALVRDESKAAGLPADVSIIVGTISDPVALDRLIVPGAVVVHLAYQWGESAQTNVDTTERLHLVCRKNKARRLIYCSTATFTATDAGDCVDETIACLASNDYQRAKLDSERSLLQNADGTMEVVIVRPTVVVGAGGKNLAKLADELRGGNDIYNFIKSVFLGNRRMNLVCVENLVAAIRFLVSFPDNRIDRQVFIVSDDDYPDNTYKHVQARLEQCLGQGSGWRFNLSLPIGWLKTLFRVIGRADINPAVVYDCGKLKGLGFVKTAGLDEALANFCGWYQTHEPLALRDGSTDLMPDNLGADLAGPVRRLITGGAWAFFGRVALTLASILTNAILARLLTPQDLGNYFLVFSVAIFAAVFSQFGMNLAIVRLVAEAMGSGQTKRIRPIVATVWRYAIACISLVAIGMAFGGGEWIAIHLFSSDGIKNVVGLSSVLIVFLAVQHLLGETFRGFHAIREATIFGGLFSSLLVVPFFAALWIVERPSTLPKVLMFSILATLISSLVAAVFLGKRCKPLKGGGHVDGRDVLRIAWPLWLTNLMTFALLQADLWIVGIYQPQEQVALYGAAARLQNLVGMPMLIVNAVIPPLIAEMYAQGKFGELEKALRLTTTIAALPAFVLLLMLALGGRSILEVVFGSYYRSASIVLAILSTSQFICVATGPCGLVLMMTGYQKLAMGITLACGALTIVASAWAIQHLGLLGLALTTAGGMIGQNVLMLICAKRATGLWTHFKIPHRFTSKASVKTFR